jgi:hypothetical protein
VYGVAPFVVSVDGGGEEGGQATRFGVDITLTYAVDFGGVYEFRLGARAGVEGVRGSLGLDGSRQNVRARKLYAGGLFGLALGFRRVHILLELTAAYERWFGSHGSVSLDRGGLVLTPAFALRLRI